MSQSITSKEYFKTLSILHGAIFLGSLLFFIVAIFLFEEDASFKKLAESEYQVLLGFATLSVVVIFIVKFIYPFIVYKAIQKNEFLKHKMQKYQTASLVKFALFELIIFASIIAFIYLLNFWYLVVSIIFLILLFFEKPDRYKIIRGLKLNEEESKHINNPDAIISEKPY